MVHLTYRSTTDVPLVGLFVPDIELRGDATMRVEDTFSTFSGDWHQDVAHQAAKSADAHTTLWQAHQKYFEGVVLDLIAKLDAVKESDGLTLLDHSLVQWTQESGVITHDQIDRSMVEAIAQIGQTM